MNAPQVATELLPSNDGAQLQDSSLMQEIREAFASHNQTREAFHNVLMKLASKTAMNRDIRYAAFFVAQLEENGKGLNREAIVKWLHDYTNIQVKFDPATKKMKTSFVERVATFNDSSAKKWYEFKNKPNFAEFSLINSIRAVATLDSKKAAQKQSKLKENTPKSVEEANKIHTNADVAKALLALASNPEKYSAMINADYYKAPSETQKEENDTSLSAESLANAS